MKELFKSQYTATQDGGRTVYACNLFDKRPDRKYKECIFRGPNCEDTSPPVCSECLIWLGKNGIIQNNYFHGRRKTPTTPVSNNPGRLAKIQKLRR